MEKPRGTLSLIWVMTVLGLTTLALISCGDEDGTPEGSNGIVGPQPDTIPPASVTNLSLRAATHFSLALVWTAPGDDGETGTAHAYDVRSSTAEITEENWEHATPMDPDNVLAPKPAGRVETVVATGLKSSAWYYFALKTTDEADNWSGLSNCATAQTLGEIIPPSDVTDLTAVAIDETSFELTWTACGDDGMSGTASRYDIRYSTLQIADETDWDAAGLVNEPPSPKPAGETESFTVTGLTPETTYFFAIKTADDVGNWSGRSNAAVALAFGRLLSANPLEVYRGEETFITFQAAPSGPTNVSVHAEVLVPKCGEDVVTVLVFEPNPGGVHTVPYDFFHEVYDMYLPTGVYKVSVCWGPIMKEWIDVEFYDHEPSPGSQVSDTHHIQRIPAGQGEKRRRAR